MNDEIITVKPDGRWHVPFIDEGNWRVGVYSPEAAGPGDITRLERHTCPELFICMTGRTGLLLSDGYAERSVILRPHEALVVKDYHNGFSVDEGGYFLVVERTSFSTEYVERGTLRSLETRTVG